MSDSGFGTRGDNFDALSADEDDLSVEDGQIGGFTPFAPMWPNGWPFSVEEVNKIRSDMCKAAVGWLPEAEPVPDWKCLEIAEEVDQALLDMSHVAQCSRPSSADGGTWSSRPGARASAQKHGWLRKATEAPGR